MTRYLRMEDDDFGNTKVIFSHDEHRNEEEMDPQDYLVLTYPSQSAAERLMLAIARKLIPSHLQPSLDDIKDTVAKSKGLTP